MPMIKQKDTPIGRMILKACIALGIVSSVPMQASAQDLPKVITPLELAPDVNGVNLTTGRIKVELPKLGVPAAPRLTFERIQDMAPYISGKAQYAEIGTPRDESYSAHLGGEASLSFRCYDSDCTSSTGDGSRLIVSGTARTLKTGGSWTRFLFNNKHVSTVFPGTNIPETTLYYASSAEYADGEVITYSYNTSGLVGDPFNRIFYRPSRVDSNVGYFITFTYLGNDLNADPTAWSSVATAKIFATSAPTVVLQQLTYSAIGTNNEGTITDSANRVYQCTFCANVLGSDLEWSTGSITLPGDTTPHMQATEYGSYHLVGSVVKDGVTWNYAYANLVAEASIGGYRYSSVTVSAPTGYSTTYNMGTVEKRNVITSVTDSLSRTTQYTLDGFRVIGITAPEGNKVTIGTDDYNNVTVKTNIAKTGSGLANIAETAQYYTAGCYNIMCYRPQWYRDALGNQTDYNAYNGSGQLTEMTGPPDANGVRQKTYIEYDGSAISRKAVMRVCSVGSTCGTNQEIRTEYSYWGNTSLPSEVRQVNQATGEILRTCFKYDASGNKISETQPLGAVTACP